MKYFITGFPGTGKSTVAKAFREKGYTVYDVDREKALTWWINKKTGEIVAGECVGARDFYENHDFNWNREYLKELLDNNLNKPIFILGITSNQTVDLDLFTKTFLLRAKKELLRQRMMDRKAVDPTKQDEDVDYGFSWHKSFDEEMLKHGAIPIDASLSLEAVVSAIEKHLD